MHQFYLLMPNSKINIFIFISTLLLLLAFQFNKSNKNNYNNIAPSNDTIINDNYFKNRIITKSTQALIYCRKNKLDTNFCCLAYLSQHSGKNRFVLWDFKTNTIIKQFPVSHGCGDLLWGADFSKSNPQFSNEFESHCTSIGKYKIGKRGYSN